MSDTPVRALLVSILSLLGVITLAGLVGAQIPPGAPLTYSAPNTITLPPGVSLNAKTSTFAESVTFSSSMTPAPITATQDNYNPSEGAITLATALLLRLSSDAPRELTGLVAQASGRWLFLCNVGSFPLTLVAESTASTTENRFALSSDVAIVADACTMLQYDGASTRWRVSGSGVGVSQPLLDDDGLFVEPEVRVQSFIAVIECPPEPDSCRFQGATLICQETGEVWNCPREGTNTAPEPEAIAGDSFSQITIDDQVQITDGPTAATWRSRLRVHATDCTALTDGVSGQTCWEQDANRYYTCEPTAGGCDTPAEWVTPDRILEFNYACRDNYVGVTVAWLSAGGVPCDTTNLTAYGQVVTRAGTLQNLYCQLNAAPGGADTVLFTAQINSIDTAVACTVTSAVQSCNSAALNAAIALGDRIYITYDPSAEETLSMTCSVEVRY